MKTAHCLLWLLCCIAFIPVSHSTDWQDTGGPVGGLGYDIRMDKNDPNTLFVTDNFAGVLKTSNRGEKWQASNNGILGDYAILGEDVNIFSLTIDPNNSNIVWAGTRSSGAFGIFKSIDRGNNWNRKETGISSVLEGFTFTNLIFRGFTVEPGNSNTVYAQAELITNTQGKTFQKVHGRVFKSTDGGENWTTIWTGNHLARYLIVDPTNTNTLFLSTGIFDVEAADSNCDSNNTADWGGEGVLKSTDGGENWSNINNGLLDLYVGSLKMHPTNSNILIAGTSSNDACQNFPPDSTMVGGLYITKDGGDNWTQALNTMISAVAFDPSNPNILYAAFENGVWRSDNGGDSFNHYRKPNERYGPEDINAGIPIDLIVDSEDSSTLYANNYGGGVIKSEDSAQTWQNWSNGYSGARIKQLATSASDDSLILASGLSGGFHSQHYGLNWQGLAFGSLGNSAQTSGISVHPSNRNIILVADAFDGTLHRSIDAGESFSQVLKHKESETVGFNRIIFAPDSETVYATVARNNNSVMSSLIVYKSTDAGENFVKINHSMSHNNLTISDLYVVDESTFYLATVDSNPGDDTHEGVLFKTTDGGDNLWPIRENANVGSVLEVRGTKVIAANLYSGIWQSSDAKDLAVNSVASWTQATSIPLTEPYSTDLIQHPNTDEVYLSTADGVFSSSDYDNWTEFPSGFTGLNKFDSLSLAITENALYVGSNGGGVFRYDIKPASSSPTASQFSVVTQAELETWIESSPVTLTGFENEGTLQISVNNGQYSINGGQFSSSNTVIGNLDEIAVRVMSSAEFSTITQASISIGHLAQDLVFTATTQDQDTVPENFSIDNISEADRDTTYTSAAITVNDINAPTIISIDSGHYQINSGNFTNQASTVSQGDIVRLQLQSSTDFSTEVSATLSIGSLDKIFTITTLPEDTVPNEFSFTAITGAQLSIRYISNIIIVNGINSDVEISINNGHYQINNEDYVNSSGTISNDDTVSIQLESSNQYSTGTGATLTVAGVEKRFSITTLSENNSGTEESGGSSGGALYFLLLLVPLLRKRN